MVGGTTPKARKTDFYAPSDFSREVKSTSNNGEPYRSAFRQDYARLIHSPSFRRLQGKTQLFPDDESDFFRNRLTHSLEVAQIAKSIAIRLNYLLTRRGIKTSGIDTDCVEFAALAHDLGHPPFGHTGEHALDHHMKKYGGFEGNAQTLRILTRLEKKRIKPVNDGEANDREFVDGIDCRAGLNLTYRSLASILKYDNSIATHREENEGLSKGYYHTEASLVSDIKRAVLRGSDPDGIEFRTIEMQIMDLADDIAYSTYDFEDALKAEFTSPLELLYQVDTNEDLNRAVAYKLFKTEFEREYPRINASADDEKKLIRIMQRMQRSVIDVFIDLFFEIQDSLKMMSFESEGARAAYAFASSVSAHRYSSLIQKNGYNRSELTSQLVASRLKAIDIEYDVTHPVLSRLQIKSSVRFDIDVMKHLTYELHIRSPRLRIIEKRGEQIVSDIFSCLQADVDGDLLPDDWRARLAGLRAAPNAAMHRMRLISDFIACMTDDYALDFHARLKSSSAAALFRPIG